MHVLKEHERTMIGLEHPLHNSKFNARSKAQQQPKDVRCGEQFPMNCESECVGLMVSGGLDSCILLKYLLDAGKKVKPFYIRSGLFWQDVELATLEQYLDEVATRCLEPLTVFDLPLADVYGDHWSITGRNVPGADTPDEAVFLPGRNILLTAKAALCCQKLAIDELALATLKSNPFDDASNAFLESLGAVLSGMWPRPIRLVCPFGHLDKQQVMELGRDLPLDLTFSCIAPRDGGHCGDCNKCAERQTAFRLIGIEDPTNYANAACAIT